MKDILDKEVDSILDKCTQRVRIPQAQTEIQLVMMVELNEIRHLLLEIKEKNGL